LRKFYTEELQNLYFVQNVIRMNKLRIMKWEKNVARMGEERNACRAFVGKVRLKETSGGLL
jgi:hypothetical protein